MKIKEKSFIKKLLFGIFLFFFILILDRITKILVLQKLQTKPFHLMPLVDFVYVQNKGVAFGLFGNTNINFTLISLLSIGLIILLLFQFFHKSNPILFCFLLAGAFGNIWDRLSYGYVVDFIKIGSFYVFNVADSIITISALWIIFLVINENRKEPNLPATQ